MKLNLVPLTASLLALVTACDKPTSSQNAVTFTPNDTLVYQIYYGERLAGEQLRWRAENGDYKYFYEYNDRGRGPRIEETITMNEQGSIVKQSIKGHNYYKDDVNETFEVADNQAKWQSEIEEGTSSIDSKPFYFSQNGTHASMELLVKELLSSANGKVDLLPGGSASLVSNTPVTLNDSIEIKLIGLSGLDFAPEYVWVTASNNFFGFISGTRSVLSEKNRGFLPTLDSIQKAVSENYFSDIAKSLVLKPKEGIAITDVNIYDAPSKTIKTNMTVLIKGNRIATAGEAAKVSIPEGFELVDGSGKTLIPGLFDMHVHIDNEDGLLHLAAGVTSVRDLGNSINVMELAEKFDNDVLVGPRIPIKADLIDGKGEFSGPTLNLISSLEEGLEMVQMLSDKGYNHIKLYSSVKPEWVKPMAAKAHALDMRVSGHIPAYVIATDAVADGYDEIQHINMLFLNFMTDTVATQTSLRLTMPAMHADAIDLKGKDFQDFVAQLKSNNTIVDPTVSIFENIYTSNKGEVSNMLAPVYDMLPISTQRYARRGGLKRPEGANGKYQAAYEKMLLMIKALYDAGITIVPGTDNVAGFVLHRELENYVKAGIPASEVLYLATLGSANVAQCNKELGSIEVGKLADMILVNGNPLENISDIRKVDLTIKNGNIYDPATLYQAAGVKAYQ